MQRDPSIHIPGYSILHRLDPRAKIAILAVYSFALLFVSSWWGMGLMAALFAAALLSSRIPAGKVFGCGAVIYVLAAFAVLFNTVRFGEGGPAVSLAGLETGCFYGARILLLFWMSLLLCFTSTSTSLTSGLASLMRPLRALRVPVDDVALVLSLALRFIPLTSVEYSAIKQAQRARCAHFEDGSLWQRLRAETTVFIPLFVALFRRADKLASAMDARCYGLPRSDGKGRDRTSLSELKLDGEDAGILGAMLLLCIGAAIFL